jgi:hypothetical protein
MAFDPAPDSIFPGWFEDGTDITVPIASITGLTSAEADGTTGDWRAVLYRIIEHTFKYVEGLPEADRPTKFIITRNRFDGANDELSYAYSVNAATIVDENSVAPEA